MFDKMQAKSCHIRQEGEINTFWKFSMKDGSVVEFYSIDSEIPKEGTTDEPADSMLSRWLEDLVALTSPEADIWDFEQDAVDYDVDLEKHMVWNIEVQRAKGDGTFVTEKLEIASFPDFSQI